MNETRKGFVQLHLSVLLAGFTGLFGRLITLNEVDIVWYRMLFTSLILLVFTGLPRVEWRKFLQLCGCGALLGFHWILFYGSIKASNVSIGVICFSLIGFFTALFEPMIFRRKFSWLELLFSLITVVGVLCIFSLDARYRYGIAIGVVSSAVCALYAICCCTRGLESLVHALPRFVLYRRYVPLADSGPEALVGLHRQSDLQPRALLHHHPRLPHLRRGARDQFLFLHRNNPHPAQRLPSNPSCLEKIKRFLDDH